MGLKGKLIAEFEVRSSGDLFHELLASKPHHVSNISSHVQSCDLLDGEFGKNGSILFWNYALVVSKQVVENLDEVNKTLTFREIEGDLLKRYKTISLHLHVTTTGGDNISVVKWTSEYERLHEDVPHPIGVLEFALNVSKHVEDHHLKP